MHNPISVELDIPSSDKERFHVLLSVISKFLESHLYYIHCLTIQNSMSACLEVPYQLRNVTAEKGVHGVFSALVTQRTPTLCIDPLTFRFCIVESAFMHARHAKILIFSGRLRCHTFFHSRVQGSQAELSPSLFVSTNKRAT